MIPWLLLFNSGFLPEGWRIYEGNCTHAHVVDYLEHVLVPAMHKFGPGGGSDSVILLDNSSLHHETTAFNCLDRLTKQKWHFTYSYGHDDVGSETILN